MNTKRITNALLIAVLVCLTASAFAATASAGQADATVATDDDLELVVTENDGDRVTVQITTTAADVAGFEANITFDSDLVQLTDTAGVDLANPVNNDNNDAGWVHLQQAQADGVDQPTTTELTFEVHSEGTLQLQFLDAHTGIANSNSELIPITTHGTAVQVSPDAGSDDPQIPDDDDGDDGDGDDESGTDDGQEGSDGDDGEDGSDRSADDGDDRDGDDGNDYEPDEGEDADDGQAGDGDAGGDDAAGPGDEGGAGDDEQSDEDDSNGNFLMHMGVLFVMVGAVVAVAVVLTDRV